MESNDPVTWFCKAKFILTLVHLWFGGQRWVSLTGDSIKKCNPSKWSASQRSQSFLDMTHGKLKSSISPASSMPNPKPLPHFWVPTLLMRWRSLCCVCSQSWHMAAARPVHLCTLAIWNPKRRRKMFSHYSSILIFLLYPKAGFHEMREISWALSCQ